ncbi:MAG: ABC transporter substrate-binding protein [Acidimicrobiia bacterium]|nr:ABC transporter substrate-binding protein [Acidimicrobiia bacterium]
MVSPRLVSVLLVVTLAAACSGSSRDDSTAPSSSTTTTTKPARADDVLTLGQLAPLTGPVETIADSFTTPVRLAVEEMNFSGGVNGKPVGLVVADDGSAIETGTAAFTKLVDTDHVDAVIGPSTSQLAVQLRDQSTNSHPVVICSGSNSYGPLSERNGDRYYFRTAPSDRLQAAALAHLVVVQGHGRPMVIAAPRDTYTSPFGAEVMRELRRLKARPLPLVSFAPGQDPTRAISRGLRGNPDSLVLIGFPDAVAPALRALIAANHGPQQTPTYGSDGLQTGDLGALVDPANPWVVAGIIGTTPAGAPAGIDHPFNAQLAATGTEPFFSASTYDCAILVGLAAIAAGSDDPRAISRHFARNLRGSVTCSTFFDCATALGRGRTINYQGAASDYRKWGGFEPGTGTYDVWRMGLDARPVLDPPANQIRVP